MPIQCTQKKSFLPSFSALLKSKNRSAIDFSYEAPQNDKRNI